jgi:hypothetical protein
MIPATEVVAKIASDYDGEIDRRLRLLIVTAIIKDRESFIEEVRVQLSQNIKKLEKEL